MSEPVPPTQEELEEAAAAALAAEQLSKHKADTRARIISHMNGVGVAIKNSYPELERDSWPIQRPEAQRLIQLGEAAVLALDDTGARSVAPYQMDVCDAHFGPAADDATRMAQLWEKARIVAGLSTLFLSVAAFLNGLRARMDDRLAAAMSIGECYVIESETQTELGAFRAPYEGQV